MNKKMAANTYLSTNESKNKQTNKQKKSFPEKKKLNEFINIQHREYSQ